jgi:hypothetical protein
MRLLPFADWRAQIEGQNGHSQASGLSGLLSLGAGSTEQSLRALQPQQFDCSNTLAALRGGVHVDLAADLQDGAVGADGDGF